MDRNLARRNLRTGISMFIIVLALIGTSFAWAAVFLAAVK